MVMHDAFRQSCRARAVDDIALVRRSDPDIRQVRRRRISDPRVVEPAANSSVRRDEALAELSLEFCTQRIDARDVFARSDDGPGARVAHHGRDGFVRDRHVEGYGDEPRADDSEHRLRHLVTVLHEDHDAIALGESASEQRVAELQGSGTERAPADDLVVDDHGGLVAQKLLVKCQDIRDQQRLRREPCHGAYSVIQRSLNTS